MTPWGGLINDADGVRRSALRYAGLSGYGGERHQRSLEVEVGYHLARPFWGRGLATEAARAARDYGFDRLGFDRLISVIAVGNAASERVAEKIGMIRERDTDVKGTPVHLYSMTRNDRDSTRRPSRYWP